MENRKLRPSRLIRIAILSALCAASVLSMLSIGWISRKQYSQREAERWKGDNELNFAQIECFTAVDQNVTENDIIKFRYAMVESFQKNSVDAENYTTVFTDAWSRKSTVEVSCERANGKVTVTAVGGNFFDFHPVNLVCGSLLNQDDFMKDGLLLDAETAWMLYGGMDIAGMEVKVNGVPFVVAGVFEREKDDATEKAYNDGLGIYMHFDTYSRITEDKNIDCYEVVIPEPVEGYAINLVREKFPLNNGVAIDVTNRYDISHLFYKLRNPEEQIIQTYPVRYPYWENAARITESRCAELLRAAIILGIIPMTSAAVFSITGLKRIKHQLSENVIPNIADSTEEFFRVRARKRYLKKHGKEEK